MVSQNPFPLMPPKSTELRLMSFDEYVYTGTPSTVLYKLIDALCGTTGAGALVNQVFLARLSTALETIYFNDLDYIFGKVSFLARSPEESYTYNPMTDMLTADQWNEVRVKDAWYRARIKDFFVACGLGGTPDGIRMCVQAALAVDCDIHEVWRYEDNLGLTESLGRSPFPARNEVVVTPHKGALEPAELRLVRDMLAKICPVDTIVTVTTNGLAVQSPVPVNAAAADSEYFEVQKQVIATPALSSMPPPELLPIDLLPTETWLYQAKTDPTLAPYTAFNISAEYGYYYLVSGGSRSPIDSVTYGTLNQNAPVTVTVYELSGTFDAGGTTMTIPSTSWFSGLDPTFFRWISVPYPLDTYPLSTAVSTGVGNLVNLINATPGPFILAGYSIGALIISNVYDQLRSGALSGRFKDFLAGVAFGNPRRQAQITIPGDADPGGAGLYGDELLTGTTSNWWEFVVPEDPAATNGTGATAIPATAADETTIFDHLYADYTGSLTDLVGDPTTGKLAATIPAVMLRLQHQVDLFFTYNEGATPHTQYTSYAPVAGDVRNCVQIAKDYITSLKVANTAALQTILESTPGQQVIIYEVGEIASTVPSWFSTNLDPQFRYIYVGYPADRTTPQDAVDAGVTNLTTLINQNTGKFMFIGTGEGAMVTSTVYDELRTGSLQHRRADFLAGVAFGNPKRELGKIFPGGTDPGGHGISDELLTGTESLWWEFANPNDMLATVVDGSPGTLLSSVFDAFMAYYVGDPNIVTAQFSTSSSSNVSQLLHGLMNVWYGTGQTTSHAAYSTATPLASGNTGDLRTSFEIARDYLNTFVNSGIIGTLPTADPMATYQPANNYQVFDTTGQYTAPIPYDKADSPDNFPGGKYGIHPEAAPALNPDGTPYHFPFVSQSAYVSKKVIEVLAQGGLATSTSYQLPINAPSSTAQVFYPEYAIAYYPPAKDSTVSTSITAAHGDPNAQITTEIRDPVNFVRSS